MDLGPAPESLAAVMRRSTCRGVAVVSTATGPEYFTAFADRGIGIIPWIVEPATTNTSANELVRLAVTRTLRGGVAIAPADLEPEIARTRWGLAPDLIQFFPTDPGGATNAHDAAWTQFRQQFLRILEDHHEYHPSRDLKVSVIVPNYNHERYLDERLRSIFAQTYPPHEIIFLDDCSHDDSVAVAQRLAVESPVPFRLVQNETNSGSTFRQWLKGLDLATGDLVWIAESDDACQPQLLERLVPEFFDPAVTLAYVQSASIGPDGRILAPDYLGWSDDLSAAHWRHPYRVPGDEEVELALSQKNTIPNASAVVFRRKAELDCRAELETSRLAGDWLFYAMQIRGGTIAYIPDVLNFHRHHDHTVRTTFERTTQPFVEQLKVKARIFETFPVSPNAISASLARTIQDYRFRLGALGAGRPALTGQPQFVPLLERIEATFTSRLPAARDLRILMVLADIEGGPGREAAISLANAFARRFRVFLCNARPWLLDPEMAAHVDEKVVLLEGTLGMTPWAQYGGPRHGSEAHSTVDDPRTEVIAELIRFHRIDVIHTQGWEAVRLVSAVAPEPRIPWFVNLQDGETPWHDADFGRIAGELLIRASAEPTIDEPAMGSIESQTETHAEAIEAIRGFSSGPGAILDTSRASSRELTRSPDPQNGPRPGSRSTSARLRNCRAAPVRGRGADLGVSGSDGLVDMADGRESRAVDSLGRTPRKPAQAHDSSYLPRRPGDFAAQAAPGPGPSTRAFRPALGFGAQTARHTPSKRNGQSARHRRAHDQPAQADPGHRSCNSHAGSRRRVAAHEGNPQGDPEAWTSCRVHSRRHAPHDALRPGSAESRRGLDPSTALSIGDPLSRTARE